MNDEPKGVKAWVGETVSCECKSWTAEDLQAAFDRLEADVKRQGMGPPPPTIISHAEHRLWLRLQDPP